MNKRKGAVVVALVILIVFLLHVLYSVIKDNTSDRALFFPDIFKGIAEIKKIKESNSSSIFSGPLFYTTDGEPIIVSRTDEAHNKDEDCDFHNSNIVIYGFRYLEEGEDSYIVKLVKNNEKYKSIEDFKSDPQSCEIEDGFSLKSISNNWLLLTVSCDEHRSSKRDECIRIRNIVEGSLALNY